MFDRLGQILVAYGMITEDQLQVFLSTQDHTAVLLGDVLVSHGIISAEELKIALATQQKLRNTDDRRTRAIAYADLAIRRIQRIDANNERAKLRDTAKQITDDYPTIVKKE